MVDISWPSLLKAVRHSLKIKQLYGVNPFVSKPKFERNNFVMVCDDAH